MDASEILHAAHLAYQLDSVDLPENSPENDHHAIVNHAVAAIQEISRTFQGVSDTSTSTLKLALNHTGEELATLVSSNFSKTLTRLLASGDLALLTVDDVERLFITVATELNQGLTGERHGLWRTWETPYPGQCRVADIQIEMQKYYQEFLDRWQLPPGNAVAFAAWNEKRLNAEIHPLSDGCGRVSKGLSVLILANEGYLFPEHSSREEYFSNIQKPLEHWTNYYSRLAQKYRA